MQFALPLFADVDWIKLATFLVIATVWLINFVATRIRDRHLAKNRLPRPAQEGKDATKELAEFLKKTSTKGRQVAPQKPVASVPAVTARGEPRTRAARRKVDEQEKRRRKQPAPAPSLVNLRESELTRDVVKPVSQEQVRPSIDTHKFADKFAERAAHLGHLEPEHKIEAHLQQAFSHQVGTLGAGSPEGLAAANRNAAAVAAATGTRQTLPIAALLSGGNLRNAIILNEILERPERRW
jgi:hypothetical protein